MSEAETDRQFVTVLSRGLELLRAFRRGERYLGNGEFASRTGLPKATVNRLTYTLTRLGYLEYQAELGKYCLGAGVLALGYAYLSGLSIRDAARPLLAQLAAETESSVVLGAREQLHMVCLEISQGHPLFRLNLDLGVRVPHGLTALGRAHLCGLDAAPRNAWMQRYGAESEAASWPETEASILQAVSDYQQHGFCYSLGRWNPEVYAVGVPLVAADGSGTLALSLSGPVFNMTEARLLGELGPRLLSLRDRLQSSFGNGL